MGERIYHVTGKGQHSHLGETFAAGSPEGAANTAADYWDIGESMFLYVRLDSPYAKKTYKFYVEAEQCVEVEYSYTARTT